MRLRLFVVAAGLATMLTASASATVIDFDAYAAGRGGFFTFTTDSPLTIGPATFTGGELLQNEFGGTDLTGVYGTIGFGLPGGYTNPIVITFSTGVSGFSLAVVNNFAQPFTVSDNVGDSVTLTLGNNSYQTFSLAGTGITSVSISQFEPDPQDFDFAIDDVTFNGPPLPPPPSTVPEPSSLALLGMGVLGVLGVARRRFNV